MSEQLILEVSQVNTYIKEMMEADGLLTGLCIRGELSNYKKYPSGHHYFTLKDGQSAIRCVMFRSYASRLRFRPENGMMVLAAGRITVYPRDGAYQLYCVSMSPEGAGDLSVAFEQLKKKLSAEGLFDEEHKKPLPKYPHRVAIITSEAGAAVHDMLRVLNHRYPLAEVKLLPVRVQGAAAPGEIADAIDYANRYQVADLIITGRGGGSMEDLWAFNEEIVARAIYRSQIPVISAVGHEPDVTIADYVADVRAATPSNGAELATPDKEELLEQIEVCKNRMAKAMEQRLKLLSDQLERCKNARVLQSPMMYFEDRQMHLDQQVQRMLMAMSRRVTGAQTVLSLWQERLASAAGMALDGKQKRLEQLSGRLDAMSPLKVLSRGYSITMTPEGHTVKDIEQISTGQRVTIRLHRGTIKARVEEAMEESQ